jgi:F-type H+-transporting ATPase subunit epsilon
MARDAEAVFDISIVSPEGTLYESPAASLVVPAELGYMGILANHAPAMASLAPGRITVREPGGAIAAFSNLGRGFIEVKRNRATLLVERVESLAHATR